MKKKWRIKEKSETETKNATIIREKYHLSRIVANILAKKNITKEEDIETFLNPKRNDFGNPFEMPDMEKAVDRILQAIKEKQKILVYGDYDVDGITSSTILKRFFKDIGTDIDVYIPNRLNEGYGLNEKAIKHIAEQGYNLIITVDCGITSIKETEIAKSLGIDVIITDHHEPGEEIPKAIAVVDCKRKDNKYSFRELAGCGVAFKLTQALAQKLEIDENTSLKYLDLACIGTISDIVPLKQENRIIAKLGLLLVKQKRNLGIREIIRISGIKNIDAIAIAFAIAPRINACGRMGHQEDALELFLTEDPIEARKLAQKLEMYNRQRQDIEKKIYEQADKMAEENHDKPCLVLASEGWHHGVIGIVASKITDKYHKPSILICIEGEEARGSGRSVEGFDLHEAVVKCSRNLSNYGGHGMAIGLGLKTENIEKFQKDFYNYAEEHSSEINTEAVIDIDEVITAKDMNVEEIKNISLLEPFGEANNEPIIMYKKLKIESIRTLKDGKHLKLVLTDENIKIDAIGFNLGNLANEYQIDDKIDVVGNIEVNVFNKTEKLQIRIIDIRKAV